MGAVGHRIDGKAVRVDQRFDPRPGKPPLGGAGVIARARGASEPELCMRAYPSRLAHDVERRRQRSVFRTELGGVCKEGV